jgi:transcriptional regulator with XRE-family HTH domain
MTTMMKPLRSHHGKNTSKIRGLRSIKQEALATELGMSQSEISHLEQSEEIEESLLEKIAAALNVTVDIIKNFDENAAFYTINNNVENNTFCESSTAIKQDFSPIEKIVELYERLLQSEREKLEMLRKNPQH